MYKVHLLLLPLVGLLLIQVNAFTVNQVIGHQREEPVKPDVSATMENSGLVKPKKCPLEFKFPKPCIDLKPPKNVSSIIQKCWDEAIDTDFKCQKLPDFMKELYADGYPGKKEPMSMADFIFIDSFQWLVYFTDDISPNLCPLLKAETRQKIKSSFRSCFLNETGLEMVNGMVNVDQVVNIIKGYSGPADNISTVVGIADDCSSKADNQGEFSKCVMNDLLGVCMSDPYYQKPEFPGMPANTDYKPKYYPNRGGGNPKTSGKSFGGYPTDKKKGGGGGGGYGGYEDMKKCEPCIPLEATPEVGKAWKTCLNAPDPNDPNDFYMKFIKCLKWEPKDDKPMEAMWPQLFTPRFKLSVFFGKKSQDAHTDCMYEKLGLGNTTDVNPQGFRDLVEYKLKGDEKAKEDVIATIDACSDKSGPITSEEFTTCTVKRLQIQCGMK